MKNVLVYGWFGENNLGDELLLRTMLELMESNSTINTFVMGSNPGEIKKNHPKVNIAAAALNFSIKKIIRALIKSPIALWKCLFDCDAMIVAGGGAISDWNPESTKEMFFLIDWFHRKRKAIYLLGVGAGPITHEVEGGRFCKILSKANMITVRDDNSYGELKKIGLHKIKTTNDLFIYSGIYDSNRPPANKIKKIGLVVVPVCRKSADVYSILKKQLSILIQELEKNYDVSIIPFQYKYDYEFINELNFDIEKINVIHSNNVWDLIEYVQQQDLIIGMRYHSLVLGIELKKYVLPIVYHAKSAELCNEFKLNKYTSYVGDGENWDVRNINADDILSKLEELKTDITFIERNVKILEKKRRNNTEMNIINRL